MDKFKELQEQHQVTPKEENPFLTGNVPNNFGTKSEDTEIDTDEKERGIVINEPTEEATDEVVFGLEPDQSPVLPQTLEPEVIDNQVQPDTPPTDHEGEE